MAKHTLLNAIDLEAALANTARLIDEKMTLTDLVLEDALGKWGKKGKLSTYLKRYAGKLERAIFAINRNRIKGLFNGNDEYEIAIEDILFECRTLAEAAKTCDEDWWQDFYSHWERGE